MGFNIFNIQILLLITAVVAIFTKKIKLPYTVGLVITGGLIAISPKAPNIVMTKDLIFNILLPPLIFEATLFLPWGNLKKDFLIISLIASVGVLLAAGVAAIGLNYFIGWPLISASVFGTLIAATDPVSVIAAFKEIGIKGRLKLLMEAESLFNDGTAAVVFSIVLVIAQGKIITLPFILSEIGVAIGGGVLCGLIVGSLVVFFAKRITDHMVEISVTAIAAYGSFLLAEHFHASGILATLTSGLIFGNTYLKDKPASTLFIEVFWEYGAFVANSLIFLLIGMHIAHQPIVSFWYQSLIAIILVILGRALAIYPLAFLFSKSSMKISSIDQHIMFWGGLRGALGLALALSIPDSVQLHDQIVTITFSVVTFSVIIQGISVPWILKKRSNQEAFTRYSKE